MPENKKTKREFRITSQETERGALRTQLNDEWKDIIRDYIKDEDAKLDITPNSNNWDRDEDPVNDIDVPVQLVVWHRRLSENESLVAFIQECVKKSWDRPRLVVGTDLAKIMYGPNARAFLDDDINKFITKICEGFQANGYYYDVEKLNMYHDLIQDFYLYVSDYSQLEIKYFDDENDNKPKYIVTITENQIISKKTNSTTRKHSIQELKRDSSLLDELIAW